MRTDAGLVQVLQSLSSSFINTLSLDRPMSTTGHIQSPLEVAPATDDNDPLEIPDMSSYQQGGKTDTVSTRNRGNGTLSNYGDAYYTLPIIYLLILIQLAYQSFVTVASDPVGSVREFFDMHRETNEILEEIPEEQKEQKRELDNIHEEQIHQRDKIEDLRQRIKRLEERRRQREEAAAALPDLVQTVKELKGE